jgi:hypothetical protein
MKVTSFSQSQWLSFLMKEPNAEGFFQSLHNAKIMTNEEWRVTSDEWRVANGE